MIAVLLLQEYFTIVIFTTKYLESINISETFEINWFKRRSAARKPNLRASRINKGNLLRNLYNNYLYVFIYVHLLIVLGIYLYVNLKLVRVKDQEEFSIPHKAFRARLHFISEQSVKIINISLPPNLVGIKLDGRGMELL